MTDTPSHFSKLVPDLPLVWDSTMLSTLMDCAWKFKLKRVDGWAGDGSSPEKVDFVFGRIYASSVERYKKGRLRGETKERAILGAVRTALELTWNEETGQPWGGTFEEQWHCLGTEPYKNSKGNRAKCPYAHVGEWFPLPRPDICGECGSATKSETHFIADHPTKNRLTLVRAVIWWCDEQPQDTSDGLTPISLPDGTPAVELFVSAPLPFKTQGGETYTLAGHLDEISEFMGDYFVVDNKTTKKSLDQKFFSSYAPNVQFDTYDLLARAVYPNLSINGVLIDAVQLLKDAVRTSKRPYYKTDEQREEHLKLIGYWLTRAEEHARSGYWPMNKRNCGMCEMREFCALPPDERERAMLNAGLTKQAPWSPLTIR